MLSEAPVTALRCNASLTAEASAAFFSSTTACRQLAAIMHAGGLLQDGMLQAQSAASVRNVFSPKLRFVAHAANAARTHAMHVVNLFSSVSAFLGTPGQSNYAAANSALNAWAGVFQQCGIGGKLCVRASVSRIEKKTA